MVSDLLSIDNIISAPFMENTLVVYRAGGTECVIVDPGLQPQKILNLVAKKSLRPVMILNTHGHADHIGGNRLMKENWPEAELLIGAGDAHMLNDPEANLSYLGGTSVTSPPADRLLYEGDILQAAGLEFEVLEIPGHSPGHIVFLMRKEQPLTVLGGDVLFQGSIGRCDFPGGNQNQLVTGIRRKLFTLPDETRVYPGHGLVTTIGEERRTNPFCAER